MYREINIFMCIFFFLFFFLKKKKLLLLDSIYIQMISIIILNFIYSEIKNKYKIK